MPKYKGFLLIELLVALAILVSLISIVGHWQMNLIYQQIALADFNVAVNLAHSGLEEALATKKYNNKTYNLNNIYKQKYITSNFINQNNIELKNIKININWNNKLTKKSHNFTLSTIDYFDNSKKSFKKEKIK